MSNRGGVVRLIRVFPRRTKATPIDPLAHIGSPDLFSEADQVHISVTFTYDLPAAEKLEKEWRKIAPTKIGGPATGMRGEEFIPGLYLKEGYTITSRGCPNKCWFCSVPLREGTIRELSIKDGWNILDDNLLACSEKHIREVFSMLARQKHPIEFTGGLEAARLKQWHIDLLADLKPKQIFFAYDTDNDLEALRYAGNLFKNSFVNKYSLRAFVLIGYPKDTFEGAEKRLYETIDAGFMPCAMLYRDKTGIVDREWRRFQRLWSRPIIMRGFVNAK